MTTAPLFDDLVVRGAVLSDCGTYRYVLWRQWGPERPMGFVMLNPSTADAERDDMTVTRCCGFAKREGYGGIRVVNLFAYRATEPDELLRCPVDAVGPDNQRHLRELGAQAGIVVAAWGDESPPYPDKAGAPLRGWQRLRFRLVLLSFGHSVRSLQRTAGIRVDGIPGVQTWVAFYAIIRRGRR